MMAVALLGCTVYALSIWISCYFLVSGCMRWGELELGYVVDE
jgi:hypothetical protein